MYNSQHFNFPGLAMGHDGVRMVGDGTHSAGTEDARQ